MKELSAYYVVGAIFECTWMPISLNVLISKNISWVRRLILTLTSILAFFLALLFGLNEWNNVVLVLMIALTLYFVLNRSKTVILLAPIAYVVVMNSNYIMTSICKEFLDNSEIMYTYGLGIPYYIAVMTVIVLISLIIRWCIAFVRKKVSLSISKEMAWFSTIVILICSMVCLITSWSYRRTPVSGGTNIIIMYICTAVAILIILVAFRILYAKNEHRRKEEEHRNIMEYTKHVEEMYEELRSFRHDYVNILASLSGYIEKRDVDGLSQYFEENIMPTNERMNQGKYRLQKLSKLKDPAIKGLVSNKIIYAMNQGIDVFVDLMDDIKDIAINTIDLCRVLGIYMDNAIEAAKECENKEIKFNVIKEDNSVTFVLMNSFMNHGLSLSDMEKQNVSSKGEGRGLGLNNVKEILSRYDNVNKVTEIKDNYFIQTLIIDNKAAEAALVTLWKNVIWFKE